MKEADELTAILVTSVKTVKQRKIKNDVRHSAFILPQLSWRLSKTHCIGPADIIILTWYLHPLSYGPMPTRSGSRWLASFAH